MLYFFKRSAAFIIDNLLVGILLIAAYWLLTTFTSGVKPDNDMLIQSVFLIVFVAYNVLMNTSKFEASFGKMIVRMKVLKDDNSRLSFARAAVREFFKLIVLAAISFTGWIGYIFVVPLIIFTIVKEAVFYDALTETKVQ